MSDELVTYWLVMRLCTWDNFESQGFGPFQVTVDGGCYGYIPVYETVEEAIAASDDGKYQVCPIRPNEARKEEAR